MRPCLGSISLTTVLFVLAGCGRTESLIELGDEVAEGDTFSFEDTATSVIADEESSSSSSDDSESSDDLTTDWGDDAIDTWGEDPDVDWGETFDTSTDVDSFDTFDSFETFDTFETVDTFDTFDTSTDVDTLDTSTSTTDTDTSTSTDTSTTDTSTTDTSTTDTSTTDTSTSSTTDPGPTCGDAVACLIDCGNFSNMCTGPCTMGLDPDDQSAFFDLQICAIQSCFFLGLCDLGDFNSPECVQCRLDVNEDPQSFGCTSEGMVCGV